MQASETGADLVKPVRTGAEGFADWMTVAEAVTYCTNQGLPRTHKTIRKWAARSHANPEHQDISVRREDTDKGYRWMIELDSLDRKIAEELEYEARNNAEPVRTGAHSSEPVLDEEATNPATRTNTDPSEPVRTGSEMHEAEGSGAWQIQLLREQLARRDEEVIFLREELTHRRQTDRALNDVIQGFLTQAENNRTELKLEAAQKGIHVEWSADEQRDADEHGV